MRTRMMALERELQKREKLLQQMLKLNKAGQGFGMDIIEKLREERNLLPIYRRKAQELQGQIDGKDGEIQSLKRDPHFTRIIELQVQFASWQHEARRLESLLREPSTEENEAAKHEVDVHEERAKRLEEELAQVTQRQEGLQKDLRTAEEEHAAWEARHQQSEAEVSRQQKASRDLAASYQELLQRRHRAERLEGEIQQMSLDRQQYEAEAKRRGGGPDGPGGPASASKCTRTRRVSRAALLAPLPSPSLPQGDLPRLWALRRATARCSGEQSLLSQCLRQEAAPGLVSPEGLAGALSAVCCPCPPAEVMAAVLRWLPCASPDGEALRWPDLLAALDRLAALASGGSASAPSGPSGPSGAGPSPRPSPSGSGQSPSPSPGHIQSPAFPALAPGFPWLAPPVPDTRPMRAACLRQGTSSDELRMRLLERVTSSAGAKSFFFSDLGLSEVAAASWLEAWAAYGSAGLLLRLPLSEAAMSEAAFAAWMSRCTDAVRLHKRELTESFKVWREDMMLEEGQFRIVMLDVVGAELSEDDIDDLMLWAGGRAAGEELGTEFVDGREVLKLSER